MACNWNSHTLLVGMKMTQTLWKTVCQFLRKLNSCWPYKNLNLNISSSFIQYCQKLETTSTGELINKLLNRDTMEHSSAIKRNKILIHYEWIANAFLLHDSILFHFGKGKTVGTENKSEMPRGWGQKKELITKGHKRTFWGDGPVPYHDCQDLL